jgi:hypothetical protein
MTSDCCFILLVCNWSHSVRLNHFIVMMLFNRDSTIQKCFQKILHSLQVRKFGSLPAVRTTCHTVRTHIRLKHHPFERHGFLSGPSSVSRRFELLQLASVRTIQQPVRTTLSVRPKLQDFFPKHRYGKIAATVRTTWIPVWVRSSIRQVPQFKSRHLDARQHGPDAQASDVEIIVCIRSAIRTTILSIRTREASIWKLLASNVRPSGDSGRQGNTVQMHLSNRKDFQRNYRNFGRTVVHLDGL